MRSIVRGALWLLAPVALLLGAASASAASYGVRDNAHFFSPDAVQQADQIIRQIVQRHQHDVLIETIPSIPQDQRQAMEANPRQFWEHYVDQRALAAGVRGVYVLVTRQPAHIQAAVGNVTRQQLFTLADRDELVREIVTQFKAGNYDQGLLAGVHYIQQQMDANAPASSGGAAAPRPPVGLPGRSNVPRGGWGIGGIACVVIGVLVFIVLIRGIFGRSGSSYRGYPPGGYPPQGGYPPGAYPPGGGYYGGGGSGFGRGFLGGLLGGALGGYAADRWLDRGQQQQGGYVPPPPGSDPNAGADTSFSSSGADFGSNDPSSGADFGSNDSGGSADFGSGGGADFGGGGGSDFGGGGDSGSSGSDF